MPVAGLKYEFLKVIKSFLPIIYIMRNIIRNNKITSCCNFCCNKKLPQMRKSFYISLSVNIITFFRIKRALKTLTVVQDNLQVISSQ